MGRCEQWKWTAVLLPLRRGNRPPVFFVPAPLAVGPILLAYATLAHRVPEGWATLAGSIEVVRVPGDHTTYLGDHVDEVAAILGRWLDRV
jgi:hypothetical protein